VYMYPSIDADTHFLVRFTGMQLLVVNIRGVAKKYVHCRDFIDHSTLGRGEGAAFNVCF
jgi:hypothetical protein